MNNLENRMEVIRRASVEQKKSVNIDVRAYRGEWIAGVGGVQVYRGNSFQQLIAAVEESLGIEPPKAVFDTVEESIQWLEPRPDDSDLTARGEVVIAKAAEVGRSLHIEEHKLHPGVFLVTLSKVTQGKPSSFFSFHEGNYRSVVEYLEEQLGIDPKREER